MLWRLEGVKGGRSPAERTLEAAESSPTLEGSGQAKPCCAWLPSPSGGEERPADGAGLGVGRTLAYGLGRPPRPPRHPLVF
jgi:hypothetical protein